MRAPWFVLTQQATFCGRGCLFMLRGENTACAMARALFDRLVPPDRISTPVVTGFHNEKRGESGRRKAGRGTIRSGHAKQAESSFIFVSDAENSRRRASTLVESTFRPSGPNQSCCGILSTHFEKYCSSLLCSASDGVLTRRAFCASGETLAMPRL